MRVFVPMLSWVFVMVVPIESQATHTTVAITVDVGGTQFTNNAANPNTVEIPDGTYGGIIIQGHTAGTKAKVVADNVNKDTLRFSNAKIRGTSANTQYRISFWGTFDDPPSNSTWYKISGVNNSFVRQNGIQAATGSWITAIGRIEFPEGSSNWYQIANSALSQLAGLTLGASSVVFPAGAGHNNTLAQEFNGVNGNRVLKGEVYFTFADVQADATPATYHELRIPSANGIFIYDAGSGGPGGGDCEGVVGLYCGNPVTVCKPRSEVGFWARIRCLFTGNCPCTCPEKRQELAVKKAQK